MSMAAILDFEKAKRMASGHPGYISLRHLELLKKEKETIVKGPNKVMGPATGLLS